jgi:hypothetical protein
MKAVYPSRTLAFTYNSTRHHSPEDQRRHFHRHENLKFHSEKGFSVGYKKKAVKNKMCISDIFDIG